MTSYLRLTLIAVSVGAATYLATGDRQWSFAAALMCYVVALARAHPRLTMDRPSRVLLTSEPNGDTRASMKEPRSLIEIIIARRW
jgi:hypothetical protein